MVGSDHDTVWPGTEVVRETVHAVRCKRTGEMIGMKLDGGTCVCPSANECVLHADDR